MVVASLMMRFRRELSILSMAFNPRHNVLAHANARVRLRTCDRVGSLARCLGPVRVYNAGRINIGDHVALGGPGAAVHLTAGAGGILGLGDEVTVERGAFVSARSFVSIGSRVRLGPYCIVSDSDQPIPLRLRRESVMRGIMIGDDVWIGARVTVLPGVRIGARAVIATGSVVAADVSDDALVAGNPASVLRIAGRAAHPRRDAVTLPAGVVASDTAWRHRCPESLRREPCRCVHE